LPLDGDRKPAPFLQTEFDETEGRLSPDGRWMAYTSNESGAEEIYVQSFTRTVGASGSRTAGKWRISTGGGSNPKWRRDGKELFYVAHDGKLMVVEVKSASTFEADIPRGLFETRQPDRLYAVTSDGQRFLLKSMVAQAGAPSVTVVLNWAAVLKR
jgi:Tol biopolymer transport system component